MNSLAIFANRLADRSSLVQADMLGLLTLPRRSTHFAAGTHITRQGDLAHSIGVLLNGFAAKTKTTGRGARQVLSVHIQGELIDLQNILVEKSEYNVEALTSATVAFIPKRAMLDLIENRPAIRLALWIDILADASISGEWLLNVGQRTALERVAHLICELSLRQEVAGTCKGPVYEWPMTQEQFGDATGLTAVHINRMLKTLRDDGIISTAKRSITIRDWPRLKQVADFSQGYLLQQRLS